MLFISQLGFSQTPNCALGNLIDELKTNDQLKAALKETPELSDAWKKLDDLGDDIIKNDPDALKKINDFDVETGGKFDELSDEFKYIPDQHKRGWVDHLEQRTVDGKVLKAGDNADKFKSFDTNDKVPSRYTDDSRFDDLAYDPAEGKIKPETRQEAMAGLEAESQGLVDGPISRDPSGGLEFIDGNRKYWDVKAPNGKFFDVGKVGESVQKQLRNVPDAKIILDTSYISDVQLNDLRGWMSSNL